MKDWKTKRTKGAQCEEDEHGFLLCRHIRDSVISVRPGKCMSTSSRWEKVSGGEGTVVKENPTDL